MMAKAATKAPEANLSDEALGDQEQGASGTSETGGMEAPKEPNISPVDPRKRAVRVKAGTLHAALKDVLDVVQARNTIPILNNVRFGAGDGRIELTVTDLDCWAIRELASDDQDGPASKDWVQSVRPFTVTLPAKPLADVLGAIDGDAMVTIEAVDTGKVTVSAGRARFRLPSLPVEDFPLPPSGAAGHSFEIRCSQLADALAAVKHAISNEETRYYLNGVYLHPLELHLVLAATDGHRLARLTLDAPDGAASWPACIVGRRTVGLLDKLLHAAAKTTEGKEVTQAMVSIETVDGKHAGQLVRYAMPAADGGEVEVVAKTVDGTYPDYTRVIPSEPPHRVLIARAPLAEAIKRVAVLQEGKSRAVRAEFSPGSGLGPESTFGAGKLTLRVVSAELGEASEELACDYSGPEITLGFNTQYWRDALAAMAGDEVSMSFAEDPGAPVRLANWADGGESGALLQVLMPLRV